MPRTCLDMSRTPSHLQLDSRVLLRVMVAPFNSAAKLSPKFNSGFGENRRVTSTEEVIRACHLDQDSS